MIGIDVVEVERFREVLARSPGLLERFFTPAERKHSTDHADPIRHLAGTFAAKEAAMKALGAVPAAAFAGRVQIVRDDSGAPMARLEDRSIPVSISHDGGVAVAVAMDLPGLLDQLSAGTREGGLAGIGRTR